MDFLLYVGLFSLVICGAAALEVLLGVHHIGQLQDITPLPPEEYPLVSIIIPALNEAATVEPALASVLALDYPALEIIAINDRSTDETGAILERMAEKESRLKVYHIDQLPGDWLGKNHALWFGAGKARGKLLLFTDADVVMEKSSLQRAVSFMLAERLDHLAVFFDILVPGGLLNMLIIDSGWAFLSWMKPWRARLVESRYHVGVGAFNLVRADMYHRCGTHRAIANHPVDDVELGRLIKSCGGLQDCLFGRRAISVKWYGSLAEMAVGLEKNIFPFCNYSVLMVLAATFIVLLLRIWPLAAIFVCQGQVLAVNWLLVLFQVAMALLVAGNSSIARHHVLWFPLAPFVGLYMLWRATVKTLLRGGIVWRDTFYSLDQLKKNLKQ
ncbi:MAG: glycosyltransferase [Thermodesulfobacteriota bacterium]